MPSLSTLMGRAEYHAISGTLSLSAGCAKVIAVNSSVANPSIVLPSTSDFLYAEPVRLFFLNVGSNAFWVEFLTQISSSYYSITASASDNSYTASGGLDIVPAGSWIDVSGFSNGANNGRFQILQRTLGGGKVIVNTSLANESVSVTPPVFPATTPLPPVALSRKKIILVAAGNVARLMLGASSHRGSGNTREWYAIQAAYGAARAVTSKVYSGASHTSICVAAPTPPPPPPPAPPYDGTVVSLTGCPATKTITLSGGTGVWAIWNGVFTVTLNTATSPPYYLFVIDSNHWLQLTNVPGGSGYGYQWQVICKDLTGHANLRFGNNTAGSCPPLAAYACFRVPSEHARCYDPVTDATGPVVTCSVSA